MNPCIKNGIILFLTTRSEGYQDIDRQQLLNLMITGAYQSILMEIAENATEFPTIPDGQILAICNDAKTLYDRINPKQLKKMIVVYFKKIFSNVPNRTCQNMIFDQLRDEASQNLKNYARTRS